MIQEVEPFIDFVEESSRPFYEALGRVVYACSRLQLQLGELFNILLDYKGRAIFNQPQSDRVQIEMLEALIDSTLRERLDFLEEAQFAHVDKQLKGLCRAAITLLDERNRLVHAPYTLHVDFDKYLLSQIPATRSGNRHAKFLEGKNVMQMMASYESRARELANYAVYVAQLLGPFHDRQDLPAMKPVP